MRKRPVTSVSKQAAAAIGQCLVMSRWLTALSDYGVIVGQALLTHSDLKDRVSYLNIRDTLSYLLENGVVPIVNENDTVSIQRSRLGNNDRLAAELSGLIFSPLLIFLTQTNGIYTSDPAIDPKAERISSLLDTTDLGRSQSEGISQFGTGGVKTKIEAIQIAQEHGVASVVACGYDPQVLLSIIEGKDIGTFVGASSKPSIGARKRWISATLRPSGSVIIDRGAARALRLGSSL
ncbi:MAG: glutamate 5-kinase, partial [Proteobacteria bacterium]